MRTEEELETAWRKETPTCGSCGWCPLFYEVDLDLNPEESTETHDCYWAVCTSKDADDPSDHRGYYLYVKKD